MRRDGFTLLELMIAITLFSSVMIIAVAALLGVISFQRKSSILQRLENNINFAVRSMTVDISVGDLYYCGLSVPSGPIEDIAPQSCWASGGPLLVFRNVRDEKTVYRLDNGAIWRCVDTSASGVCDSGGGVNYLRLTSVYINVDSVVSSFYVDGAERIASGDTEQPRAQVVVRASATSGKKNETEVINIQTTVSQFIPDF